MGWAVSALDEFINLRVWPTGRALHCVRELCRRAEQAGDAELLRRGRRAEAEISEARGAQKTWARERPRRNRPTAAPEKLVVIDAMADRCLSGIQNIGKERRRAQGVDDPDGREAVEFLAWFFPHGADAITSLPHAEQRIANEEIVDELRSPRWQPVVASLGVEKLVARLESLLPDYGRLVDAERAAALITWPAVQVAVAQARQSLLEVVVWILAYDRDRASAQAELLAPVREQEGAVAAALARGTKRVPDINPDTGAPEEGDLEN